VQENFMAAHEGARRIKLIGKLFIAIGSFLGLAWWFVGHSPSGFDPGNPSGNPYGELVGLMLLPFPVGGAIWVLGWIVEGFFKQPDVGRQMRQP
jgi:hypothetical protein